MKYLQIELNEKLVQVLKKGFPVSSEDIQFSIPPDQKFGDLSTTLPFILAKKTKRKPQDIGEEIIRHIGGLFDFISDVKLAGGGFLNFHIKKDFFLSYLIKHADRKPPNQKKKVIVEHTSINPNKSAHIGHLRNSCLGDILARSLKYNGFDVEIQNYIDDTGVQVADVVWGLLIHQKKSIDQIRKIKNLAAYLWELYAQVHRMAEKNQDIVRQIRVVLKKIENKTNPEFEVSDFISKDVLRNHIELMDRMGIRYDLLVRESDIIELDFFNLAAEILKNRKVMYASRDPEKKGCWVIRYERENIEKIIVRSDSTVTYIGKDIAYALWKLDLLQRDFFYRLFYRYPDARKLYITSAETDSGDFHFGRAKKVYNVIGQRQAYLQNIISQVLDEIGSDDPGENFIHFSYEMVSLTPRCVQEMGFAISPEDQRKAHVDVSGRKGIAVKADDLIEKLTEKSLQEVRQRNPAMQTDRALKIARDIAVMMPCLLKAIPVHTCSIPWSG
jgi:arginyl-tRNA synthetase